MSDRMSEIFQNDLFARGIAIKPVRPGRYPEVEGYQVSVAVPYIAKNEKRFEDFFVVRFWDREIAEDLQVGDVVEVHGRLHSERIRNLEGGGIRWLVIADEVSICQVAPQEQGQVLEDLDHAYEKKGMTEEDRNDLA